MAQIIDKKQIKDENEALKKDILMLQAAINSIDRHLISMLKVGCFGCGNTEMNIYEKFCVDKVHFECVIELLENVIQMCDNLLQMPEELNRFDVESFS